MSRQPTFDTIRAATLVDPSTARDFSLSARTTRGDDLFPDKADAKESIRKDARAIDELQDALYAERKAALLVVVQGMDTAGKDGVTKKAFRYSSPVGVRVFAFEKPTEQELAHDYLWRVHRVAPRKGFIAVFNRSHYEDVLAAKVRKLAPEQDIEKRYGQINQFEKHLVENGTRILKLMLHISKEEQGKRLRQRLDVAKKRWKFSPDDLDDRKLWDDYQAAYETMLRRCTTPHAPWRVVPADSRPRRNAIAARLIRAELESMAPAFPDPGYRVGQFAIE